MDKVLSNIVSKVGNLRIAFIRGDYALGIDSGLIDLVLVGDNLNISEVERVRLKTETLINRKISIVARNLRTRIHPKITRTIMGCAISLSIC